MKSISRILILATFFVSFESSAQILERLKKEVKSATENKVMENVSSDENNDNFSRKRPGQNSLTNGETTAPSESESVDTTTATPPAKIEDSYSFATEMEMEIVSTDKKGKQEQVNFIVSFGENCFMNEIVDYKTNMRTILDYNSNSSIMLDEDKKTATAMSLKFVNKFIKSAKSEDFTITKTGNTKSILGYNCEEYVIESDDNTMHTWYTTEVEIENSKELQAYFAKQYPETNYPTEMEDAPQGISLESHIVNKKKPEEKTDYFVRRIENKEQTVDLSNYTVTNLF